MVNNRLMNNLGAAPRGVSPYHPAKGEYYETTNPDDLNAIFRSLISRFIRGEPLIDDLEAAVTRAPTATGTSGYGMSAPPPPM